MKTAKSGEVLRMLSFTLNQAPTGSSPPATTTRKWEMVRASWAGLLVLAAVAWAGAASGQGGAVVPGAMERLLPAGYVVLSTGHGVVMGRGETATLVVMARPDEEALKAKGESPARPLLAVARGVNGSLRVVGRNDVVVLHIDEGGQCDPFLDGGGVIAVKGAYFTVQNGVACGSHWTDYVTFRFDPARGAFVFDSEIIETLEFNPSREPNAEAMVPGPRRVVRGDARRAVSFETWRRIR